MSKGKLVGNIVAVLITIVVLAAAGIRLWANQQRLDVPMLWNGMAAANGNVHVVVGNDLYIETPQGKQVEKLPLSRVGMRKFNGDLLAMPDGSVILAAGRIAEMDVEQKLRKLAREARRPGDPTDYLQRCDFTAKECELLNGDDTAAAVFEPGHVFGLSQGPADRLLAADVTAHEVHLLAADGRIIDTIDSGFEFPNEIHLTAPGEAMVVDTNHHRLVYFAVDESGFGKQLRDVSILEWPGVDGLQRFPFAWARTPDGAGWLLVADNNMGDAILIRSQGGERREIPLPGAADPVDFVVLPDRLLLLDQGTDRILSFEHSGKPLPDFGSPDLQETLARHADERRRFAELSRMSLYLLVAIVVIALPVAVIYMRRRYKEEESENAESIELAETDAAIDSVTQDSGAMLDRLSGIYHFNRSVGFIDPSDRNRIAVLGSLLVLTLLATQFLLQARSPDQLYEALADLEPHMIGLAVIALVLPAIGWIYMKMEELRVDQEGIRYSSPLPEILKVFHPDWTLPWQEIKDIRLTYIRTPGNPQMWRLVIETHHGNEKTLVPLQWTEVGAREPGIRLADVTRLTEGLVRGVIRKRTLFRVLATQMSRLRALRGKQRT